MKIPSVREMAVTIEVNPNTVMRTYSYLQEQGIIYNQRGIGYFVEEEGFEKTVAIKKEEFIKYELPLFFKKLHLLNLTLENIDEIFKKQQQETVE